MNNIAGVQDCLALLGSGQASSALCMASILCDKFPSSVECQTVKVRALFALREFDNVLRATATFLDSTSAENEDDNADISVAVRLGMMAAFELSEIKKCKAYCLRVMKFDEVLGHCYTGKCAEYEENKEVAIHEYRKALQLNPFCCEAMDALINRHLLGPIDLIKVIESLSMPANAEMLRSVYKARVPFYRIREQLHVPRALELLHVARRERNENNLQLAYNCASELLLLEPYSKDSVCLLLSILVDMKASQKLFELSRALCKKKSRQELAVYAIGCFHYTILNFEKAGRYFIRAKELNPHFAEAHIAFGHCYARLEEGEEARKVYEKAFSLFPGLHHCAVYLGMQYSRKDQWERAEIEFKKAFDHVPSDPTVLNELGVVYFSGKKFSLAHKFFQMAFDRLPNPYNPSEYQDCIVFNLATSCRKLRLYSEAVEYYSQYIKYRPRANCGHFALGLTWHLSGDLFRAIKHYEDALQIKYDSVCAAMLEHAVENHR